MAWLIEKEDYKVGQRYIPYIIGWFGLNMLGRLLGDGSRDSLSGTAADNIIDWTGMPEGLADVVGVFIMGTIIFPPVLLYELWLLNGKRKRALAVKQGIKTRAYYVGQFIGRLLSKFKRSEL